MQKIIYAHNACKKALAIYENGHFMISSGDDYFINIWNILTGKKIRRLKGHEYYVSSIKIYQDGNIFLSGSHDWSIKIWFIISG